MKNKIGIIGGMGPFASVHFYRLLLEKSSSDYGAINNDDYPEIIIVSLPIPDFISDTSTIDRSREVILDTAKKLIGIGCSQISMVCNTAHIFQNELEEITIGKFVSLIDIVAEEVKKRGYVKVGVLATRTTVNANVYGNSLEKHNIDYVYPGMTTQNQHEELIRKAIAGNFSNEDAEQFIRDVGEFQKQNKLDTIILGCTELPLIYKKKDDDTIDCMSILADELLGKVYSK